MNEKIDLATAVQPVELARMAGVTKQYIYEQVKKGRLLTFRGDSKKPYFFSKAQAKEFVERDVQPCGFPTHKSQQGRRAKGAEVENPAS